MLKYPFPFLLACLAPAFVFAQEGASREAKDHIERANARNALKHATDRGAAKISRKAQPTTISEMLAQQRPAVLDDPKKKPTATRLSPFERTIWVVNATITSVVKREDGDYYLVLDDGKGHVAVAEIPDPEECKGSPFLKEIKAVHGFVSRTFHPTAQPKTVKFPARIKGIGFFGGTKSGAKNGARLDPALEIMPARKA